MKNKKLMESIRTRLSNALDDVFDAIDDDKTNTESDFVVFMKAMNGQIIHETDNYSALTKDALPVIRVIELGLEKMFQYEYSENDHLFELSLNDAAELGYDKLRETITANSIEAKQRYRKSHICRKYIVSSTRGWPCTIKATEEGWSTSFGYDGDYSEEVDGKTADENFRTAYKFACDHYGDLITEKEYEKRTNEAMARFSSSNQR